MEKKKVNKTVVEMTDETKQKYFDAFQLYCTKNKIEPRGTEGIEWDKKYNKSRLCKFFDTPDEKRKALIYQFDKWIDSCSTIAKIVGHIPVQLSTVRRTLDGMRSLEGMTKEQLASVSTFADARIENAVRRSFAFSSDMWTSLKIAAEFLLSLDPPPSRKEIHAKLDEFLDAAEEDRDARPSAGDGDDAHVM